METCVHPAGTSFRYGRAVTRDHETFELFMDSNFGAYDSYSDRYPAVLKAGLKQHSLELSDVVAVTQSFGLWAICTIGVFRGDLRGVFKKRIEVDELIRYSEVTSIEQERTGPHTSRIVLIGGSRELASIDPSPRETGETSEMAGAYRNHICRILAAQLNAG